MIVIIKEVKEMDKTPRETIKVKAEQKTIILMVVKEKVKYLVDTLENKIKVVEHTTTKVTISVVLRGGGNTSVVQYMNMSR